MRIKHYNNFVPVVGLLASLLMAPASQADIVISGTRVIYPAGQKSVTVKLENRGGKPLLVQSWIDDGRENTNPQELNIPFLVTPPVSRIDPSKGQTIKVTYLGTALPQDKESMFWFNVLEVPPKANGADDQNILQLAFRTRIKLFYRPAGLKGNPSEAAKTLVWKAKTTGQNLFVDVKNPSPFHVSFSDAFLVNGKAKYEIETVMLKPGESQSFKVKGLAVAPAGAKVEYSIINDFGGASKDEASL
ncbi:fimbrial chaperone [Scandinavium lactucae]|uniref:Fimbrial chaperone n=1 Tax=Scandinavium lactucae TaxID=3095028 RepID=A0ABU4QRD3_9ENTR|nr:MULTISPECIES: fimbrial chaperone [unclassified Scandinavium]MDX6041841.1 fimbrial chaperone [Scandinavium sp. V105_6]MDX6049916.1 fimbrial chaperone [Scandinavium sp. V105_1]